MDAGIGRSRCVGIPGTIVDAPEAAAVTIDHFIRAANGGDVATLRVP
jgi:hypothetical protein